MPGANCGLERNEWDEIISLYIWYADVKTDIEVSYGAFFLIRGVSYFWQLAVRADEISIAVYDGISHDMKSEFFEGLFNKMIKI